MHFLLAIFVAVIATTASAQHFELEVTVLTPKTIHKIIGDFPRPGSAGEAEDYKILLGHQTTRTDADCKLAQKDSGTSLATLFGGAGGILSKDEVRRMNLFLLDAYANAGINSHIAKKAYKRPRPYEANTNIRPCISLEKSYAYPSGHTLMARLFARILSKVYPERAEKLLARAAEYSLNRVIGGVHHPSDVTASFVLADYLANEMIKNDDFVNELVSL